MTNKLILVTISLFSFLSSIEITHAQKDTSINAEKFLLLNEMTSGYRKEKRKNNAMFQGINKTKKYFEGWYFKMVSSDLSSIISIIPGISLSENGKRKHAFIQVINGKTATTQYFSYPIEEFSFSRDRFAVKIGQNYFSEDSILINLKSDTVSISGKVFMSNKVKLWRNTSKDSSTRTTMKIMGWYRYAPFMQCYHGVVSLNHDLKGMLTINNQSFNFNQGHGYIEKDWGKSMPSSWIWIQSNSFTSDRTSFMLSIANVPWMGSSFPGFLGFFLNDTTIERFGTYSKAKIKIQTPNPNSLVIEIEDKDYNYNITITKDKSGMLKAPVKGSMDRRIAESIDAKIKLKVTNKLDVIILSDSSSVAGFEMVGDIEALKNNIIK